VLPLPGGPAWLALAAAATTWALVMMSPSVVKDDARTLVGHIACVGL